ncbi:solute carrier family 49 member A3-like [Anguilla rostrata]|uniref:solute carrier family 49 member A3-like n=1 Tax=Anguilla rostrata TaxID=7938 RepID=UPI0030CB6B67
MEINWDLGPEEVGNNADPSQETKNLLGGFKVYKRRWFILSVVCMLNCSNAVIWLSFAPVANLTARYLGASLDQVNWLSLVYMVVAVPFCFVTTWMLDTLGLRISLILGSWLNMVGSGLRFLSILNSLPQSVRYFPLLMGGQTLCALAQTLIIFSPTKLAALWFPQHQRATANMIASMCKSGICWWGSQNQRGCWLGLGGRPPSPPSASAESSNSEPFLQGIKLLLMNRAYMILLLCMGSGIAVFTCFSTVLDQILCVKGYSDEFAGICGALFILFGVVGAAFLGFYVDRSKKFIEATKLGMSLCALACIGFAVVSQLRDQKAAVAVLCSLFGFFGFSLYPVAMELSVESSYPVGEASSSGLLFISGQIQSIIYMVILQALTKPIADSPFSTCGTGGSQGLSWRVPVLVMAGLWSVGTCCFVLFFHTEYRRLRAEADAIITTETEPGRSQSTRET